MIRRLTSRFDGHAYDHYLIKDKPLDVFLPILSGYIHVIFFLNHEHARMLISLLLNQINCSHACDLCTFIYAFKVEHVSKVCSLAIDKII